MGSTILVTGGTGTLGQLVVPRLAAQDADLRVLSRSRRDGEAGVEYVVGDLDTGDGVENAVKGADVVVHLAGAAKGDGEKARQLMRAIGRGGVRHLVYISVVGADRTPVVSGMDRNAFGYIAAKREAEELVEGSGVPWTTLRATQFHELLFKLAEGMAKLPVVPVPSGFHVQPVDGAAVADRLVELTLGEPAGLVADIAGPKVYGFGDPIRSYLKATGRKRLFLPMRMPGKAAAAFRAGANLSPDHGTGRTWEEFLTDRLS
ncbi:uncharacterized protein YbjT (DUF2867 family) [Kribbella amoyensis]|uniref:Uncharacterized protein YbjT (DUF2867 family) n=1 Tax=Kribbella amoyensis TaxID=996641 RepID=A0A561B3L5_9ACTN|nr:NAD(P)H-binding protein [Kribbella amoyensis]TWD73468.1 uncharacterized protein YbjT (DUF2867 family) [Kribbella amoyensis]